MVRELKIGTRSVGPGNPAFVIAELSANHHQSFEEAVRLLRAAHAAGADAVKLQTYTADTLTIASSLPPFQIGAGTLWAGKTLHALYQEAFTPWEWQPKLKAVADDLGIPLFSSPFDSTAVDFLEQMGVPAYKIASFEILDLDLIGRVARTGKPLILSTGMASVAEIDDAVRVARTAGATELALLKCTSAYPANPHDINLRTIPHLAAAFDLVSGLSDHTMGIAVPVAAVALGASIVEKHFTLSRAVPGPDSPFSLEPEEFRALVDAVRVCEAAIGDVRFGATEAERPSAAFRRSLFVVADIAEGAAFTPENVRSIRPGHGLAPRHLPKVLGRRATSALTRGTPLAWSHVGGPGRQG